MAVAQGRNKQLIFKRQAALGTIATTGSAQRLRRVTSSFELQKETYNSADEITSTQQMLSSVHGVKQINGAVSALLSPSTYSDFMSSLLRRDYTTVTALTALSLTIAGAGPTYTITRAAGDYLAGGIKVGMGFRITAGTFNAANLNKNLLVTGVTATVITCVVMNAGVVAGLFAEGPIASATITVNGKVTYVPNTAHTQNYYTVEEFYSDLTKSEVSTDVKVGSASFSLPGTGNAKVDFSLMGLNQTRASAAYFVTPTTETTTGILADASGALLVGGVSVATVTDLSIEINGNQTVADGVVGTNLRPDIFDGKVIATGSFTAYFENTTIADNFLNETETSLLAAITAGATAAADFMTFTMSRVKINTDKVDDGETGLKRTYGYEALYNSAGGAALATQQTTISIQDSAAP